MGSTAAEASVIKLNRSSSSTDETIEMQRRKCENLIAYFTTQIRNLNQELEHERGWRTNQLAKIVKALLCFEAKLKNDQKQIRHQLFEKDTEINRLSREIIGLREKFGVKDGEPIEIGEVAQLCPNCRKQFYQLETRSVGIQVLRNGLSCPHPGDKSVKNTASSSEDGVPLVFAEARRSKRYMSKRTSGTFRDYLQTRSIEMVDGECTSNNEDSLDHECDKNNKGQENFKRNGSVRGSYSSFINSMHGITTQAQADDSKSTIQSSISCENEEDVFIRVKPKSGRTTSNSFLKKYDSEAIPRTQSQFESTDDWYASASDMDDSDSALSKPYGYNAVNPVLECVNQILLQQSMDGIMDSSTITETQHNSNSSSPIATILTNGNSESAPKESNNNGLKKRVHFSTQNSMVQVPRSGCNSSYETTTILTNTASVLTTSALSKDPSSLSYATIYSNDYEPIGSENNSSNLYVDMESKMGQDDRPVIIEKTKIPPALPPKPANLMKLRHVLKNLPPSITKSVSNNLDNESEPDYCSISEVQESVIKNVQIIADVHKNADDDASSHGSEETKTDVTDFADVPKLPNVAAIISPRKVITQDNYIIKPLSPVKVTPSILVISKPSPNILSEINGITTKKSPTKLLPSQKMSTISENGKVQQQSVAKQDEKDMMPMQEEFDWYNLDAEYGKHIHTEEHNNDVNDDDLTNRNIGIEYNLDEEFALSSNSSLPSEGGNENDSLPTENNNLNSTTIKFVPMLLDSGVDELSETLKPLNNHYLLGKGAHMTNNKTFDSFLEDTGLATKPLPQKRKIFYSAPFV